MIWPFGKKKKEEQQKKETKEEQKLSESNKENTQQLDPKQIQELLQKDLGIDPQTLQLAMERVKELSKEKICIICGEKIKEGEDYEEIDFMGTKLYMHTKCKKKFQKQILKLMRSGQLNKVIEMYTKMLKQGLPTTNYTFKAEMK